MFCPRNGENRPRLGFLECIWKFRFFSQYFNFFTIWSIRKVYSDCYTLEQISYLWIFWFLRYSPKCSSPVSKIAGFLNQTFPEQNDKKTWFSACWYKFIEIKNWLKNIRVDVVINGCAHSGRRALKLAVSHIVSSLPLISFKKRRGTGFQTGHFSGVGKEEIFSEISMRV